MCPAPVAALLPMAIPSSSSAFVFEPTAIEDIPLAALSAPIAKDVCPVALALRPKALASKSVASA